MEMKERVPLNGELSIYTQIPGEKRVLAFKEFNLITTLSKKTLLATLYQYTYDGSAGAQYLLPDPITTLWVGTGGCYAATSTITAGTVVIPEDPTQTDLHTPRLSTQVTYTLDLVEPIITFLADIDQSQGNNMLLTEAGLFKNSGRIFNVKNHPGIPKTEEFSVHYEWTIRIQ